MYNTKNYTEQGGEKTVIGGEIVIEGKITVADGGEVEGITVPEEATTETAGIVKMAANVAKITDDTVTVEKFNDLIDALVAAGLMADDEE